MRKIIIGSLFLLILQTTIAQTKIALKAGYNFATARVRYSGVKQPTNYKNGYDVAILFKAPFDGPLHFSPFLQYTKRGYIIKPLTGNIKKIENSIQYFDIVAALSLDFGKKNKNFVISFGPSLGITKFGKERVTDINNQMSSQKMRFGYLEYGWFDMGLTCSVGFHLKKFLIEAGYFHGLTNINNNEEFDGINIRNRTISLNLGYYLK